MNLSKPIMSLLLLSGSVTGVFAGQDWDAARHQVVEQIAASEESRLQQRLLLQKRQEALNPKSKQQHRWQKRQHERLGVSIHASNSQGRTTMSGEGPR